VADLPPDPFAQRGIRRINSLDFGRYMLGGSAVTAILAGCGGLWMPIGTPGAMLQKPRHRDANVLLLPEIVMSGPGV